MHDELLKLWDKSRIAIKDIEEFDELQVIQRELNLTNARQIVYHAIHNLQKNPVCQCGTRLAWHPDKFTYRDYCSKKCTSIFTKNKRTETCIEKYGVDHFSKSEQYNLKVKQTSIEKYGVEHYSKTEIFKGQVVKTNNEKYGVDHPAQNIDILAKTKQTCTEKYGVDHPNKSPDIQRKLEDTILKKYGVKTVLLDISIQAKIKDTLQKKYGVEHIQQNKEISEKTVTTRRNNFYPPDTLTLISDKQWLSMQNESGMTIGEIAKDVGVSGSNLCKIFHKHGLVPKRHPSSSHERKIIEILDGYEVKYKVRDREVLNPQELDIFIPSLNLAIEVNGGYWHSEQYGKDNNYHISKTKLCEKAGVELWHFFDWEINEKLSIISSKISHKLKKNSKLPARKLTVATIIEKDKKKFIEDNHIQGDCSSKVNLALVDDRNTIYAMMTFGKSRFNKNYDWELLRFCTLKNHSVTGGASKLLSYFVKHIKKHMETLISYCNLRFSSGDVYEKIGFTHIHTSPPNYFYVSKNGTYAGSRNQWQKHMLEKKLPVFNPTLSEKDNMAVNGYFRVWDCGQKLYIFTGINH